MPVESPAKSEPVVKQVAIDTTSAKRAMVELMPLSMVMLFASPYLSGRNADDAIKRAHRFWKESRFTSTIDILGEAAANVEDCARSVELYKHLIDAIASLPLPVRRPAEQITVSIKPSAFCTIEPDSNSPGKDTELQNAYERIKSIVDYAFKHNRRITLEAEDHHWIDFHLDVYFSLINAGYTNLGTVLQSRLFRTARDIKRFDERTRVRMVIGIYNEPADIAYLEKPIMKEIMVDQAGELAARGTYVELATHDADCVAKFFHRVALPQRLPGSRFETQYLQGVPRKELQQSLASGKYFVDLADTTTGAARNYLADLAREGTIVRMYLPFGTDRVSGPYCKRRLAANPNMITFGIKNLLGISK